MPAGLLAAALPAGAARPAHAPLPGPGAGGSGCSGGPPERRAGWRLSARPGLGSDRHVGLRLEEAAAAAAAAEHRRLEGPPGRGAKPRPRLGGEFSARAPACNCWEKWLCPDSDLAQGEGLIPTGLGAGGAGGKVADRPSPFAPSAERPALRRAPLAGSAAAASPAGSRAAALARPGPVRSAVGLEPPAAASFPQRSAAAAAAVRESLCGRRCGGSRGRAAAARLGRPVGGREPRGGRRVCSPAIWAAGRGL